MTPRDFDGEIAEHEAAIAALKRAKRAERYTRTGIMPPVRSAAEYGHEGGIAFIAKHGAAGMPRGGRPRNLTYAEIMATNGGSSRVASTARRLTRLPSNDTGG